MFSWIKRGGSLWFFLLFLVSIPVTAYYHAGKKIDGVIWSDQEGYYIYLPAVFIHGSFENLPFINGCSVIETDNGPRTFTKYTYGVALMQSPFFLMAHQLSPFLNFPQDGRSSPYIWAIMLAAIFYMLAGLALLKKILLFRGFSNRVTNISLVLLALGTNLFYYTFRESGMSHVYSFFLFSLLLYAVQQYGLRNHLKWLTLIAFCYAVIVLIRPTNAIIALVLLFASIKSGEQLTRSTLEWIKNWKWWLFLMVALVLVFAPQFIYWKSIFGEYVFYSYGNEGFTNWNHPKFLQVLFSHQNGWIIYSPIVLFSFYGIWVMIREKAKGRWMAPIILLIATYVFASWWAWWFGGAYGHRCYVEYVTLLAIPMATAVKRLSGSSNKIRNTVGVIALLMIFVNLRMSDFYHGPWDGPNWTWTTYFDKVTDAFYLY